MESGGQVIVFNSELPNHGPHALTRRDEAELIGTDKEYRLFQPQDESWSELAEELTEFGVGTTLFAFPNQSCDLATLGEIVFLHSTLLAVETFLKVPCLWPLVATFSVTHDTTLSAILRYSCQK